MITGNLGPATVGRRIFFSLMANGSAVFFFCAAECLSLWLKSAQVQK